MRILEQVHMVTVSGMYMSVGSSGGLRPVISLLESLYGIILSRIRSCEQSTITTPTSHLLWADYSTETTPSEGTDSVKHLDNSKRNSQLSTTNEEITKL